MQKLLRRDYIILYIDDSVENSIGGGHILGQKLLVYKRLLLCSKDDSVENSRGEAIS